MLIYPLFYVHSFFFYLISPDPINMSSLSSISRSVSSTVRSSLKRSTTISSTPSSSSTSSSISSFITPKHQSIRRFGGGGAHESVTYEGVTISKPKKWQLYGAHFFGGLMYFWILYRLKNDYKVFLGLEHPWDAHEHHDEHEDENKAHH